jgi:Rieske Fe-S protein
VTTKLSRRGALLGAVVALGAAGVGVVATMLYPRKSDRREIIVPAKDVPRPGDAPRYVANGRFFLSNLAAPNNEEGALLALFERCTHLHCAVGWRDDFRLGERESTQYLVCPCHGGVFTKAGVRVFGPPPRSLDTLPLRVTSFGDVAVDVSRLRTGDDDNPSRAIAWPRG